MEQFTEPVEGQHDAQKRRRHTVAFKFRVALEPLVGSKTIGRLSRKREIHANMKRAWKRQLQEDDPNSSLRTVRPVRDQQVEIRGGEERPELVVAKQRLDRADHDLGRAALSKRSLKESWKREPATSTSLPSPPNRTIPGSNPSSPAALQRYGPNRRRVPPDTCSPPSTMPGLPPLSSFLVLSGTKFQINNI